MLNPQPVPASIRRGTTGQRELDRDLEPLRPHRGQDLLGVGRQSRKRQVLGLAAAEDAALVPGSPQAPPAAERRAPIGLEELPTVCTRFLFHASQLGSGGPFGSLQVRCICVVVSDIRLHGLLRRQAGRFAANRDVSLCCKRASPVCYQAGQAALLSAPGRPPFRKRFRHSFRAPNRPLWVGGTALDSKGDMAFASKRARPIRWQGRPGGLPAP